MHYSLLSSRSFAGFEVTSHIYEVDGHLHPCRISGPAFDLEVTLTCHYLDFGGKCLFVKSHLQIVTVIGVGTDRGILAVITPVAELLVEAEATTCCANQFVSEFEYTGVDIGADTVLWL